MKKLLLYDAMHRTMKMFVALLFTCLLAVGSAWAESVTYTFSSTSGTINEAISFSTQQNNATTAPAFNDNLRLYYGSGDGCSLTLTPATGIVITEVTINSASSSYTPTVKYNIDGGDDITGTWESTTLNIANISAFSSIRIRNANTSNTQLRITSITIEYTSAAPHTVTFPLTNETLTETSAGSGVTLPTATTSNTEYSFAGWTTSNIETETTTAPTTIIPAGAYSFSQDISLYPIFKRTVSGATYWQKLNDLTSVTEGTYILITPDNYAFNGTISSGHGQHSDDAIQFNSEGEALDIPTDALELTLTSYGYGFQMYAPGKGFLYAKGSNSGNLDWHETETSYWTFNATNCKYNENDALLRIYNNTFRTYASNNGTILNVAKKVTTDINYYISTPEDPEPPTTYAFHKTVTPENAGSISCLLDGNDIESAVAGDNVYISATPANGYDLTNLTIKDADNNELEYNANMGLVMPESDVYITATFAKLYNVTCPSVTGAYNFYATHTSAYAGQAVTITASPAEGYTRNGNPTLELDENYNGVTPTVMASEFNNNNFTFIMPESNVIVNVSFSQVPTDPRTIYFNFGDGNEPTPLTETTPGAGVTLPTPTICAAATTYGYTFAGWATTQISGETSTQPDNLMAGGSTFNPTTDNVTLYAVYSKGSTSTNNNVYVKVTTAPNIWDGQYLIVNEDENVIFDGSLTTLDAINNNITVTINDGTIDNNFNTDPSFTITSVEGGYSIKSASGDYIGITGSSNGIKTSTTYSDSYINTITLNNGEAVITGSTSRFISYNGDNGQKRFRYYQNKQKAVYLYKLGVEEESTIYTSTIDCTPTVETPVISLASGEYNYDQSVTITCATEGATIRYTLDGTEPTENATEYTEALTINESATLVAKAFKDDYYPSEQATATYIMPVYLENIAAFKAAVATDPSTTIRYRIAGNVVVTAINGGQTFVQDNSGQLQSNGLMLYKSGGLNLQIGNVVNNVIGYYNTYSGAMELAVEVNPLMTEETGTPTAVVVSISDFLQNPDLYLYNLIKVEDIHFGATNTYVAGTAGNATALSETEDLDIYNNFKGLDMTLTEGGRADVTGIAMVYVQNNAQNLRLQPRFNNDITLKTIYHDTVAVAACETYNWSSNDQGDDQDYTTSGYKSNTIVGETNDDVYTINLTINHATAGDTTATACASFTWHGITYTETPETDPTFTTTNVNGCDSVVTLHLTIFANPTFDITATPQPVQNTFCTGEEITLGLDGVAAGATLLEEDFSSCTTAESVVISGLTTFPTVNKVYHMNSGDIKFGSGSGIGSLTSQSLDLSSPFTVTFTAKQYDADENGPVNVTVGGITKSVPALTEELADYTLEFDAATATSTVTIATTNSAKRAYINNIKVETTGSNVAWSTQETTETITVVLTEVGTTTYSATVTDNHNCTTTKELTFDILPRPVVDLQNNEKDTLCPGESITLTSANSNDTIFTYQWYKDDVAIEGATARTLTLSNLEGANSGIYKVLTSNIACSEMSNTYELLVNGPGAPGYNFVLTAPADIYDTIYIGYCDVAHAFVDPTITHYMADTRFGVVTLANDAASSYSEPGDYTINWVGTDACGNIATCTQTLHIAIEACPNAIDYDGNEYTSVRINCECWTTRDLVSEHYSDGTAIENVMSYSSDIYPNETENVNTYGHLYNWNSTVAEGTALNTPNERGHIQGICPEGWYLPTADQVNGLVNGTMTMNNHRASGYWLDGGGNNSSALTLLPCGQYNEQNGRYENLTGNFYMWNAYEYTNETAKTFEADCHCYLFKVYNSTKGMGYGVRCIMERTR